MRKGIDVSEHQGLINWEQVKGQIDYVILRVGYGDDILYQDDKYFKFNIEECTRLGIPFGVYIYSYAQNVGQAISESQHVLRLIKGYNLSYPVYLDLEDNSQNNLSNSTLGIIANTFCNEIEKAGYYAGIYANTSWWESKLTDNVFTKWTKWVAQYNINCTYQESLDMWQYASDGQVNGINGNVDMNYCYADFPKLMNKQEVKQMVKGIILYKNDSEYPLAVQLARKLGYVVAWSGTFIDYSVFPQESIWAIGGEKGTYTSYLLDSHLITGNNRYETIINFGKIIGSL